MANKNIRIKLRVPESVLEGLQTLAERRGVSTTEVLTQALGTEIFLEKAIFDGRKIYTDTETPGEFKRIIFKHLEKIGG